MSELRTCSSIWSLAFNAVIFIAVSATGAASAAPASLATYVNERFGYSVAYPQNTFLPQPEAGNGDGREFRARNGKAQFLVWASYNVLEETPAGYASEAEAKCIDHVAPYKVVRPTMVVVSCETADGIEYAKRLIVGDVLTNFVMSYPKAERTRWDPVVAAISRSLVGASGWEPVH